ncbi:5-formyltetrahydrofolate cyclo-ligase [Tsuneonella sp. HG249]
MSDSLPKKDDLRRRLRAERRAFVDGLPPQVRALVFHRPPVPVLGLVPVGKRIGLYLASPGEAPAGGYARFFSERGHAIGLPWFADRTSPMSFRAHRDPFGETDLGPGPYGAQPEVTGEPIVPEVLFVPLVAFTADGHRLGQGGGHYDRWMAEHPDVTRIGLAWDLQEVREIPHEPHDMRLHAVVTTTRVLGPFA